MRPIQCSFREHGRRCTRNGSGKPVLCRDHQLEFYESPVDVAFDRIEDLRARASDSLIDGISSVVTRLVDHVAERVQNPLPPRPRTPRPPPAGSPPPRSRPAAGPDPREVLCFDAGVKLTRALVKARQRDLLKIVHPDKSGSVAASQRINAAAAALLKDLP